MWQNGYTFTLYQRGAIDGIGRLFCRLIGVCSKQSETGKIFYTYPNGKVGQVRYYDNPDDSLTYRKDVFYSTGANRYVGKFGNGKKNGVWIWWYPNGNKKDQCKYADGLEVNTIYHWYKSGVIQQIEIVQGGKRLTDGKEEGLSETFYRNGQKEKSGTLANGLLEGKVTYWDSLGKIISVTNYKMGKIRS